jgi:uncharacterized protein (TIGR02231 family)
MPRIKHLALLQKSIRSWWAILGLLLAALPARAATYRPSSTLDRVTVYPDGARLERKSALQLAAGRHEVVITGMTGSLAPQSLQCTGQGNFRILSVRYQPNYLEETGGNPRVRRLQDSIRWYEDTIAGVDAALNGYKQEAALMEANRDIGGGKGQILLYEDVFEMARFFRRRFEQIDRTQYRLSQQKKAFEERLRQLKAQLQSLRQGENAASSAAVIVLEADAPATAQLSLSYFTGQARWRPAYNFTYQGPQSPVDIRYKAEVRQSTGVDWEQVRMELSPLRPSRSNTKPELEPWYLSQERPRPQRYKGSEAGNAEMRTQSPNYQDRTKRAAGDMSGYVSANDQVLAKSFVLETRLDIPSDGQPHVSVIDNTELPATFRYEAVPKREEAAFLQARITEWQDAQLLPGEVTLFIGSSYVGRTQIDPRVTSDTLEVSFGRDQQVQVKREEVKDYRKKSFFGNKVKKTYGYQITIANQRDEPIEILVEDQIPISRQDDIEVRLLKDNGAALDGRTGLLSWEREIDAGEAEKIDFKYELRYPSDYRF